MKQIFSIVLALLTLQVAGLASAHAQVSVHGYSSEEDQAIADYNARVTNHERVSPVFPGPKRLPFAEYGQAGYLIFNDQTAFLADQAKHQMAKNLPKDMTLVIYTSESSINAEQKIFAEYAQYIDPSRLKVIYLSQGDHGFWARDGVPVPTWTLDDAGKETFSVVDAKYYKAFENDLEISQYFEADLVKIKYMNEGGNFLANEYGDCIIVNNKRAIQIPDAAYKAYYGCQKMLRLPFIKGIGHIDESVKFMDAQTVITDDPNYAQLLSDAGYKVVNVPRPQKKIETYINALVVNGTAFVPVFNESTDDQVLKIYQSFGLKTVALDSTQLSNDGEGSIHCITMVYPPVPFNDLLGAVTAKTLKK